MKVGYISIGSNIGDRFLHLREAVHALHSNKDIVVLVVSSIYETAPVGFVDQADFLNIVVQVETTLSAQDLLATCQGIENKLGRVREVRWGPRTVDLDILLYDNQSIVAKNLVIPHPRMHERAFVLIPLLEIAPVITHPKSGKSYAEENVDLVESVLLWKQVDCLEDFFGSIDKGNVGLNSL